MKSLDATRLWQVMEKQPVGLGSTKEYVSNGGSLGRKTSRLLGKGVKLPNKAHKGLHDVEHIPTFNSVGYPLLSKEFGEMFEHCGPNARDAPPPNHEPRRILHESLEGSDTQFWEERPFLV